MDSDLPLPYDYVRDGEWRYTFITRDGIHYNLYFLPLSELYPQFPDTYSFNIEAIERTPHPIDRRIAATVVDVLRRFFSNHVNAMIMVCDSIDGKERKRRMLFDYWFGLYNDGTISKMDASASTPDYEMFLSLYYRNDNPNRTRLLAAFRDLTNHDLYEIIV